MSAFQIIRRQGLIGACALSLLCAPAVAAPLQRHTAYTPVQTGVVHAAPVMSPVRTPAAPVRAATLAASGPEIARLRTSLPHGPAGAGVTAMTFVQPPSQHRANARPAAVRIAPAREIGGAWLRTFRIVHVKT